MTAPASPLASATSYVRISSEDAPQQRRLALLGAALMGFASAVLILLTASHAAAVIPSAVLAQSAGVTGAAGVPALELAETIPHTGDWCAKAADFTRKTLKAVADRPVASLLKFSALAGARKFEASDVIRSGAHFLTVCDSSWDLLRVSDHMPLLSDSNSLIGPDHTPPAGDSGYEALLQDNSDQALPGSFYLLRESVIHKVNASKEYRARILHIQLPEQLAGGVDLELAAQPGTQRAAPQGGDEEAQQAPRQGAQPGAMAEAQQGGTAEARQGEAAEARRRLAVAELQYSVVDECPSAFVFEGDSKGFEGATALRGSDGVLYLLGLCEGNSCAEGAKGKDRGHGRVVVMTREDDAKSDEGCVWKTVRVLELPPEAAFMDYSAITLHPRTGAVAVSSQEDAQLWVGKLVSDHGASHGHFDAMSARFEHHDVYDFPRTSDCQVQYCNIEGVHWIDGDLPGNDPPNGIPSLIVAASDKMKSRGRQHHACLEKDQSMHMFALP